jgi:hypothetical protein
VAAEEQGDIMGMRSAAAFAAAMAASVMLVAPASAAQPVHIEATTPFGDGPATFVSNLAGCESGTVTEGRVSGGNAKSPRFGIFNGFKVFSCDGGGEFTLRLQAKFDETGSRGSWAFVGGEYAGNGTLVGEPFEVGAGITDIYDGTLRP